MTDLEYMLLKRTVSRLTGIDLGAYKQEQMRRRLDAFIQHRAQGGHAAFCRALERDATLLHDLADMLTINVTEFFRDPGVFEHLRLAVLPELITERRGLRIWSAGCSKGCEAYTLAILLEELDGKSSHSILATDLDETALTIAREGGPYPPSEVKNVPPACLSRYFKTENGRFYLAERLRWPVTFRTQNLLADTYESGFDLIVCRNVMIYFTPEARRAVTRKFFDALSPKGLLLLGSTEALMPDDAPGFQSAGASLYRKSNILSRVPKADPGTAYAERGA